MLGGSLQRILLLDCIGLVVSAGSSRYYWLDRIGLIVLAGLSGSYRLNRIVWIVSVSVLGLIGETGFYVMDGLLMDGWDVWTQW